MVQAKCNSFSGRVRGFMFAFLMFHSSYFGSCFLLTPLLPVMLFAPRFMKTTVDIIIWTWKVYLVSLYEVLFQTKVKVIGDLPGPEDCTLIIMNHRTRFDWLYLFSFQVRYASVKQYTISMKNVLKFAPGVGWAMQLAGYIFLRRNWDDDKVNISRCIQLFRKMDFRPQVLLFPEGTDLTTNTKVRSDKFAEANGLPKYEYVLHPRTTGFTHLVQEMKKGGMLDSVVDITISYPGRIPQNELDIVTGNFPSEIHFYVKTYPNLDVPSQKEDLDIWCNKLWSEKEAFLKDYYEKKRITTKSSKVNQVNEDTIKNLFFFTWIFWTSLEIMFMVILWWYPVLWFYVLFCTILYTCLSKYTDGLGLLVASAMGV